MMHQIKYRFLFIVSISVFAIASQNCCADLVTDGDVAIVGGRADNEDAFAFAVFTDIAAGGTVKFTDNNYLGGGTGTGEGALGGFWDAPANESTFTWQNTTGGIVQAGTVIVVTDNGNAGELADIGTIISSGDMRFPANGEAIYAYCGDFMTDVDGNLYLDGDVLFGIQFANTGNGGQGGTGQANPSGVGGLVEFTQDNGQFDLPRDDQPFLSNYFNLITDSSNWTTANNGNNFGALNSTDFTTIPEPSNFLVVALFVASRLRRRSRT